MADPTNAAQLYSATTQLAYAETQMAISPRAPFQLSDRPSLTVQAPPSGGLRRGVPPKGSGEDAARQAIRRRQLCHRRPDHVQCDQSQHHEQIDDEASSICSRHRSSDSDCALVRGGNGVKVNECSTWSLGRLASTKTDPQAWIGRTLLPDTGRSRIPGPGRHRPNTYDRLLPTRRRRSQNSIDVACEVRPARPLSRWVWAGELMHIKWACQPNPRCSRQSLKCLIDDLYSKHLGKGRPSTA